MKFYRRKCGAVNSNRAKVEDMLRIWPSALTQLTQWYLFLLKNKPVTPLKYLKNISVVIFSDASDHGWGAVLCTKNGFILSVGSAWEKGEQHLSINERELIAAEFAAKNFGNVMANNEVLLCIDNTTAMQALRKGSSAAGAINSAVLRVLTQLGLSKPIGVRTIFVRSEHNIADEPSRGKFEVHMGKLATWIDEYWRRGLAVGRELQTLPAEDFPLSHPVLSG